MQYGLHILEFTLGWPAKGNSELIADCITSIAKAKRLTDIQAYKYLVRAIGLAKEQGIKVDQFFFRQGEYSNIRPLMKPNETAGCAPECKARHGQGYHWNDVKWIMKQYVAHVQTGGRKTPDDFFAELDTKRIGGAPAWKR
jgi:hypothetical protein